MSVSRETAVELWKIQALLLARESHKRKKTNAQDLAKRWDTTERQAYRHLAEADEIFKRLVGVFRMQPDYEEPPALEVQNALRKSETH